MDIKNFEFKAKVENVFLYENKLLQLQPVFYGEDHQTDTYFATSSGRLKIREGNIENALIHYDRSDIREARLSEVILYPHKPDISLKHILIKHFGVKVIVRKKRKIYFIDNVKFHFDEVIDLGSFIEVEAIDQDGKFSVDHLRKQCHYYLQYFGITSHQLVEMSYSDMLLDQMTKME